MKTPSHGFKMHCHKRRCAVILCCCALTPIHYRSTAGPIPNGQDHFGVFFDNPSPQKDPSNPFYFDGPQYSGVGTANFTYGTPGITENGVLKTFIDSQQQVYADGSGSHFLTSAAGEVLQNPNGIPIGPSDVGHYASWLGIVGNPFGRVKGISFPFAELTFQNGETRTASNIQSVDLNVHSFPDAIPYNADYDQTAVFKINIVTTPNTGTREQNADYLYFPDHPEFGSLRVFEGGTATVNLLGFFDSFHFAGFGDLIPQTDDSGLPRPLEGFWSPSIGDLPNPQSVPDSTPAGPLLALVVPLLALGRALCDRRSPAGGTAISSF